MEERGFTVYATINGGKKIQFVSKHMYDFSYKEKTPRREQVPVINVIVDLEKDEFQCSYIIGGSIDTLNTPECGSFMNDEHFDSIVGKFEIEAKWMARLSD
jgi:hypothetical protein